MSFWSLARHSFLGLDNSSRKPRDEDPGPLKVDIQKRLEAHQDDVLCVDLHPYEPWLLASLQSGHIYLWNYENNMIRTTPISPRPIYLAKFFSVLKTKDGMPNSEWIVCVADELYVLVIDCVTMDRVSWFQAHVKPIRCLSVHPSLPFLMTGSDNTEIKLWEWSDDWSNTYSYSAHQSPIVQIVHHPNNRYQFASASSDGVVKIWNAICSSARITLKITEELNGSNTITCLSYCPDSPLLAVGDKGGFLRIYNYESKKMAICVSAHQHEISTLRWLPEIPVVITSSIDRTLRIWHSGSYQLGNVIQFEMGRIGSLGISQYPQLLKRKPSSFMSSWSGMESQSTSQSAEPLVTAVLGCERGIVLLDISVGTQVIFERTESSLGDQKIGQEDSQTDENQTHNGIESGTPKNGVGYERLKHKTKTDRSGLSRSWSSKSLKQLVGLGDNSAPQEFGDTLLGGDVQKISSPKGHTVDADVQKLCLSSHRFDETGYTSDESSASLPPLERLCITSDREPNDPEDLPNLERFIVIHSSQMRKNAPEDQKTYAEEKSRATSTSMQLRPAIPFSVSSKSSPDSPTQNLTASISPITVTQTCDSKSSESAAVIIQSETVNTHSAATMEAESVIPTEGDLLICDDKKPQLTIGIVRDSAEIHYQDTHQIHNGIGVGNSGKETLDFEEKYDVEKKTPGTPLQIHGSLSISNQTLVGTSEVFLPEKMDSEIRRKCNNLSRTATRRSTVNFSEYNTDYYFTFSPRPPAKPSGNTDSGSCSITRRLVTMNNDDTQIIFLERDSGVFGSKHIPDNAISYWEVHLTTVCNSFIGIGLQRDVDLDDNGGRGNSISFRHHNRRLTAPYSQKWRHGVPERYGRMCSDGDRVGVRVDTRGEDVALEFYVNGASQGIAYSDLPKDIPYYPYFGGGDQAQYLLLQGHPFYEQLTQSPVVPSLTSISASVSPSITVTHDFTPERSHTDLFTYAPRSLGSSSPVTQAEKRQPVPPPRHSSKKKVARMSVTLRRSGALLGLKEFCFCANVSGLKTQVIVAHRSETGIFDFLLTDASMLPPGFTYNCPGTFLFSGNSTDATQLLQLHSLFEDRSLLDKLRRADMLPNDSLLYSNPSNSSKGLKSVFGVVRQRSREFLKKAKRRRKKKNKNNAGK